MVCKNLIYYLEYKTGQVYSSESPWQTHIAFVCVSQQDETEKCPDAWFRKLQPLWEQSLKAAANFVGANFKNLVFVQNATSGINAVLKSLDLSEGDSILITNQTYGAVQKSVREVCKSTGAKLLVLNITYPTEDFRGSAKFFVDEIVQHFTEVLQKHPEVKLAVIDYIGSSNAVLYPVKELVDLCHQYNVSALIDGAHAPGQEIGRAHV